MTAGHDPWGQIESAQGANELAWRDNWSKELSDLSMRDIAIPLNREAACAIGKSGFGETPGLDELKEIAQVTSKVADAIESFGKVGAFVKLSSRSPKDAFVPENGQPGWMRVTDAGRAMHFLFKSERVFDDLCYLIFNTEKDHSRFPTYSIWIREWVDFLPESEFRCLIVNGEIGGISEYNLVSFDRDQPREPLVTQAAEYEAAVRAFLPTVIAALPPSLKKAVAVDVTVDLKSNTAMLIEINGPNGCDPILFEGLELDGKFRFVGDGHTYNTEANMENRDTIYQSITVGS